MYVLNSSRPLFRDNPKLRQAVNFAVDRGTLRSRPHTAARPTSTSRRRSRASRSGTSTRSGATWRARKALAAGNLRGGKAVLYVPDCRGAARRGPGASRAAGADRARASRSGRSASTPRPRPTSAGSATRTSRGTWRSSSGRPTSSIPPATSTGCSTPSTPAARTWPGSTSPSYLDLMRRAARLQGAARERAYADLDLQARARRGAARAARRPERGDARLGAGRVPAAAAGPRPDDRLPQALLM